MPLLAQEEPRAARSLAPRLVRHSGTRRGRAAALSDAGRAAGASAQRRHDTDAVLGLHDVRLGAAHGVAGAAAARLAVVDHAVSRRLVAARHQEPTRVALGAVPSGAGRRVAGADATR